MVTSLICRTRLSVGGHLWKEKRKKNSNKQNTWLVDRARTEWWRRSAPGDGYLQKTKLRGGQLCIDVFPQHLNL